VGIEDLFNCDYAPYTMEDDLHRVAAIVNRARYDNEYDPIHVAAFDELLEWVYSRRHMTVGYQLEPPPIAGDGSARARGLEAEQSSADESEDDDGDDEPPTEPWTDMRCPKCGSDNTRSQYTSALGDRFVEARCEDCDHYDSWFD
jgi:hypothetical protein